MKRGTGALFILILLLVFNSCRNISDEKPTVIACPIFVLDGGELYPWAIGNIWEEPGYHCSEKEVGGDDLTGSVIVDCSELNVDEKGIYEVSYTASNMLGCTKTATRAVYVTDGVYNDISGSYEKSFGSLVMEITQVDIPGLFNVEYLFQYQGGIFPGVIATIDANEFQIPKTKFTKRDNRDLYFGGYAEYNAGFNESIYFNVSFFYEDGTYVGSYNSTWYKM